ncbi:MAG: toprim domain-containing protein, partial [Sphingomonas sp.]
GYLRARKGLSFGEALRLLEADAGIDFRDAKAVASLDRDRERRERKAASEAERRRRIAYGLWQHAAPLHASPAEAYLRGRAIDFGVIGKYPGAIRFRHDCWHTPTSAKIPAMVSAMVSLDAQHVATHRTFLARGASGWAKAPVEGSKSTLGQYGGAHIPINKGACGPMPLRDVPAGTVVYISEGIEDALSVAMAHPDWRIVAAATLGNIGAVALPAQVRDVVVIGQHDRPGSAADNALDRQIVAMQARELRVACLWPEPRFKDFNDQLRGLPMVTA